MIDATIRRAAFDWLAEQVALYDDVLPWRVLIRGFDFKGTRVPLVSMQGIFKPRACVFPLSIRTAIDGPYDDRAVEEGRFLYAYRGTDPNHSDNVGLRELMRRRIPHAAFDKLFVGVRPDGIIEVRRDILEEEDGPMLLHGLKRLHRTRLSAPRRAEDRPDPELLGIRYERFVEAGG